MALGSGKRITPSNYSCWGLFFLVCDPFRSTDSHRTAAQTAGVRHRRPCRAPLARLQQAFQRGEPIRRSRCRLAKLAPWLAGRLLGYWRTRNSTLRYSSCLFSLSQSSVSDLLRREIGDAIVSQSFRVLDFFSDPVDCGDDIFAGGQQIAGPQRGGRAMPVARHRALCVPVDNLPPIGVLADADSPLPVEVALGVPLGHRYHIPVALDDGDGPAVGHGDGPGDGPGLGCLCAHVVSPGAAMIPVAASRDAPSRLRRADCISYHHEDSIYPISGLIKNYFQLFSCRFIRVFDDFPK